MGLESATYISDLDVSNPVHATDGAGVGDDHLRLIKSTLKATFPSVTGAVTPTHTELNYVDGVTSAIQTQLDSKTQIVKDFVGGGTLAVGRFTVAGSEAGGNVTLPASPTNGDIVVFVGSPFSITIFRNGKTINGSASDYSLGANVATCFVYYNNNWSTF